MKRLTCEMCNGTDVVKVGEFFECQYCGTKYSVETARKMMIEGTVEVQGTVKVDNTDQLQNSLNNARNARAKEDWERAEKYYQVVEAIDPQCYEATIYSTFAKLSCLSSQAISSEIAVTFIISYKFYLQPMQWHRLL